MPSNQELTQLSTTPQPVELTFKDRTAIRLGVMIGIGITIWCTLIWIVTRTIGALMAESALRAQ